MKRFVPPKKGLGYVGESSNKGKQVVGSCSSKVPKPCHRKRRSRNFLAKGLTLKREKLINHLGQVIPSTLMLLITMFVGIVVL